jgi:hypothetical protein
MVLTLLTLAMLVGASASAAGAGAVEPGTGAIKGSVTVEGGGVTPQVEVCTWQVVEGGTENELCARVEVDGSYEIPGLVPGEYKVEFWPRRESGYVFQYYNDEPSWKRANPVSVTANTVTPDIDAVLEEGATISGTVTAAATGFPAANVEVCAEGEEFGDCAETGPNGTYTIQGLPAGEYFVYFYPEGSGLGLLAQAYSDRSFSERPNPVVVGSRSDVTGIDAALQAGGKIQGAVHSAANGAPLAGVEVCLTEAARLGFPTCLQTPASGLYGFFGLPSGSWKVVFSPALRDVYSEEFARFEEEELTPAELAPWNDSFPTQWWNAQASFATATPIAVTAPAITEGIDATLGTPPPALTIPPVAPAAVIPGPPTGSKPVKVAKAEPKRRPLKCKRGFVKRKLRGKARCVKAHKRARHANKPHRRHAA